MAMRTRRRALVLLCVLLLSSLARAQTQPRTWRLDFYETGGPGVEAYSFDRLVIEPLAWPVRHFELMASAQDAYEVLGSWPLRAG